MELTAEGQRTLGCLIEKALATPQQYPLTLNALQAAVNQRNNRDPVVDWDEQTVRDGIDDLKRHELVTAVYARGSRTPKYAHRAAEQLDLDEAQLAVLALLLLRGPQTPGELRSRTERLHAFGAIDEVDATLAGLADHPLLPMVTVVPRQPGQKEARYAHLLGADDPLEAGVGSVSHAAELDALRAEVEALAAEVEALRAEVAGLRSGQA